MAELGGKRKYQATDPDKLTRAINWVCADPGRSFRQAESMFGIDRKKIKRSMEAVDEGVVLSDIVRKPGRPTVLSSEVEQRLASYASERAERNMGVSSVFLRQKACSIAKDTGGDLYLASRKDKDVPPTAMGYKWFRNFSLRNRLVMKKPQGLSAKRYMAFSEQTKTDLFSMYTKIVDRLGLQDRPERIWNYDEKSQRFVHRPEKIVARKGQSIDTVVSGNRESFTVVLMCNAAGILLRPLIIVKGLTKRSLTKWKTKDFPEAYWSYQVNGYNSADVMQGYMEEVVIPAIQANREKDNTCEADQKDLLISDGFGSHEDLDVLERAIKNNLVMFNLPSHVTSKVQPLDKYVMSHWNKMWDKYSMRHTAENPDQPIDYKSAPGILRQVYESISVGLIRKSWKDSGMYPINPELVPADKLPQVESEIEVRNEEVPCSSAAGAQPTEVIAVHEHTPHRLTETLGTNPDADAPDATLLLQTPVDVVLQPDAPDATLLIQSPVDVALLPEPMAKEVADADETSLMQTLTNVVLPPQPMEVPATSGNVPVLVEVHTPPQRSASETTQPVPIDTTQTVEELTPVSKQLRMPAISAKRCDTLTSKRKLYTKGRIVTGEGFYHEKLKKEKDKAEKVEQQKLKKEEREKKKLEREKIKKEKAEKTKTKKAGKGKAKAKPKPKPKPKPKKSLRSSKRIKREATPEESDEDSEVNEDICYICMEWDCPEGDSDDDDEWERCDECRRWYHAKCCDDLDNPCPKCDT